MKETTQDDLQASQKLLQIRLESLPKMNLLVQSDTTSILVRQLTCLLNIGKSCRKSDTKIIYNKITIYIFTTWRKPEAEDDDDDDDYLAYTEYQSH